MSRAVLVLAGVALAAAVVLLRTRTSDDPRPMPAAPPRPPSPTVPAAPEPLRGASAPAPEAHARRPGPDVPRGKRRLERALIDRYIAVHGLEDRVTEAERRRLVEVLRNARRWARRARRARTFDPALRRRHREAVLEADRVFRATLHIRLGRFIAEQRAAGQVEDLGVLRR
jgi:hypothetical protein